MFRAWARMVVYGEFSPPIRRYAAGAAFLRSQGVGARVDTVHGLDVVQRSLGHLVVESGLPHPGQGRASGYEGEGYVIVRHQRTEVVERALRRLITTIQIAAR